MHGLITKECSTLIRQACTNRAYTVTGSTLNGTNRLYGADYCGGKRVRLCKGSIHIITIHRFVLSLLDDIAGVHSIGRRQIVA